MQMKPSVTLLNNKANKICMKQLFITQIYQKKIKFDLLDLASEIELIKKSDHDGQLWSATNYQSGYTSYSSLDKLHQFSSTFEKLQKKIDKHVDAYLKNLDYQASTKTNLKMTNCWVNIMPGAVQHTAHIHPQSVISGTYYVSVPKGASPLKLEDPRLGFLMNAPLLRPNAKLHNQRFVSLAVKPSDLILFESWLRHEVPANASKSPRISVSFNYGWV